MLNWPFEQLAGQENKVEEIASCYSRIRKALYSAFSGIRCLKSLEFRRKRSIIGLRKNAARKLNERSVKQRKLSEEQSDEFFLCSEANETSGIFSAALIFSFVLSFVSRQKKEQI